MCLYTAQAIEHLDAFRQAPGQDHCQVMLMQHIVIQVKRAVAGPVPSQVIEQGGLVIQGDMGDPPRVQLQYVKPLLHLDQVTMIESLGQ
ncbi:hypothetical protein D3C81_1737650 [compost metagenome]